MNSQVRPGYKLTEVGVIPEDWSVKSLGQLTGKITTGKLDANAMVEDGAYPFFTCARDVYKINDYAFDTEALLVSGNGANVGYIHYYFGKFNAYQRTYVLSEFSADITYLKMYMGQRLQERLRTEVNAGNTPYIVMGTLTEMQIGLPSSIDEQRVIAIVLSDMDTMISRLDQLISKKRDIKQATMQQLLNGLQRLSGFSGEWERKRLGEIGYFLKGSGVTRDQSLSGDLPCIRYGEIYTAHNDYIREFKSYISVAVAETATLIKCGDILFAGSGETKEDIGKCVSFVDHMEAYAGGDIVIFRPKNVDSLFLGYALNTPAVRRQKASRGQGDAVVHISANALASVEVLMPNQAEQSAIANVLADMDAELLTLETRRNKARELRQGMMQELLTGRIRLSQNSQDAKLC